MILPSPIRDCKVVGPFRPAEMQTRSSARNPPGDWLAWAMSRFVRVLLGIVLAVVLLVAAVGRAGVVETQRPERASARGARQIARRRGAGRLARHRSVERRTPRRRHHADQPARLRAVGKGRHQPGHGSLSSARSVFLAAAGQRGSFLVERPAPFAAADGGNAARCVRGGSSVPRQPRRIGFT